MFILIQIVASCPSEWKTRISLVVHSRPRQSGTTTTVQIVRGQTNRQGTVEQEPG